MDKATSPDCPSSPSYYLEVSISHFTSRIQLAPCFRGFPLPSRVSSSFQPCRPWHGALRCGFARHGRTAKLLRCDDAAWHCGGERSTWSRKKRKRQVLLCSNFEKRDWVSMRCLFCRIARSNKGTMIYFHISVCQCKYIICEYICLCLKRFRYKKRGWLATCPSSTGLHAFASEAAALQYDRSMGHLTWVRDEFFCRSWWVATGETLTISQCVFLSNWRWTKKIS